MANDQDKLNCVVAVAYLFTEDLLVKAAEMREQLRVLRNTDLSEMGCGDQDHHGDMENDTALALETAINLHIALTVKDNRERLGKFLYQMVKETIV